MKLVPCPTPKCAGLGAMLPPSPAYPHGEPALSGQYVRVMRCARCRRDIRLTPADWARIPELTSVDFATLATQYRAPLLARIPTRDFEGYGLTRTQAVDVHDAGFRSPKELEALERSGD